MSNEKLEQLLKNVKQIQDVQEYQQLKDRTRESDLTSELSLKQVSVLAKRFDDESVDEHIEARKPISIHNDFDFDEEITTKRVERSVNNSYSTSRSNQDFSSSDDDENLMERNGKRASDFEYKQVRSQNQTKIYNDSSFESDANESITFKRPGYSFTILSAKALVNDMRKQYIFATGLIRVGQVSLNWKTRLEELFVLDEVEPYQIYEFNLICESHDDVALFKELNISTSRIFNQIRNELNKLISKNEMRYFTIRYSFINN